MVSKEEIVALLLDVGFTEEVEGVLYIKEMEAGLTAIVQFSVSTVTHSTWVTFWYQRSNQSGDIIFESPQYSTNLGTSITTTVR